MEIREALKTRRRIRAYEDRAVPRGVIEDLLDCARWSPSARNVQPWSFVVITDKEMLRQIAEIADYGKFIATAPACIAVLCEDGRYYVEDGSIVSYAILLAAWDHGLGTCWVAGDKKPYAPKIAALLGAPESMRLVSLIALGYPAQQPSVTKKPLDSLVHWEKW